MRKFISIALVATMTLSIISCGEDNPEKAGALSISGIPVTASLVIGETLSVAGVTVTAEDGIESFTVSVNSAAAADLLGSDFTSGETTATVDVVLETGAFSAGAVVLEFVLTDVDGDTEDFTHVLTLSEFPTVLVRGNIETNTTWTADNIYQLDTRVTVIDGVTLTIEPGTVIKGNEGQAAAATALLVARGGKLMAGGTAALPIVFTSVLDPITPTDIAEGNYASTTSPTQVGLWGGVIILGKAPISASNTNGQLTELQIEGIPSTDPNGLYGGNVADDNSGTITYVSIRHGGTNIGAGNEINGLTLGGVGSGTTISNIEVVANADDGIEWFGGNVSVSNVIIWNSNDDGLDTDQDWIGTCTNFMVITPIGGSAMELDGPEGTLKRGFHQFTNGVIYGGADIDQIVDWDAGTNAGVKDVYFFGITAGIIASFGGDGSGTTENWETNLAAAGTFFAGAESIMTFNVAVGSKSYGPSASDFAWSWAGNSGALTGLGL